jgi:hypothetical protein
MSHSRSSVLVLFQIFAFAGSAFLDFHNRVADVLKSRGRLSQRDSLPKNTFPHAVAQAAGRDHIHAGAEQPLQVEIQAAEIEEAAAGLKVYKKVDVAPLVGIPTRDRTEHADIAGAAGGGQAQDFFAPLRP